MKRKIGAFFTALLLVICLLYPGTDVYAATGKISISVSASSVNIGDTVTVTGKATTSSGGTVYATMTLSYDASVLEYVSCTTTANGGGGSIKVSSDTFSATFKAIAAGTSSLTISGEDAVDFDTVEDVTLESAGASVTVNNAASNGNTGAAGNTGSDGNTGSTGSAGSTGTTLSADNSLKSLTISPGTLSPSFKGSTVNYTATVDNSVTSIAVSANVANAKATVESVTGNSNLAVGENTISIVVKAENGTTATYKIKVTRLAAGEATTPQDSPENEEESEETEAPEVSEETVVINGANYGFVNGFSEDEMPTGFQPSTVMYNGQEYEGLISESGSVELFYLVASDSEMTTGKFYVYDAVRNTFYDFTQFTCGNGYVIALLPPVDASIPESYSQTTIITSNGTSMTVYQEEAEEAVEFYLFYGVNAEGTEGWYRYDSVEGTYQRAEGNVAFSDEEDETIVSSLQEDFSDLSQKYKSEKSFARNVIAILVFVIAILVIIIINMLLHIFRKKDDDDFEEDVEEALDVDETEHLEKMLVKEVEKADKKKEKADDNVKSDKFEIEDLND